MARKRQFGDLTLRSQDRIAREGARYGLTRRQSRERYNRGTFNALARDPVKRIPERAPYYPVTAGQMLKERAIANMDAKLGEHNRFGYNRFAVLDAIQYHASDTALQRLAGASEDELETWAAFQKRYQYKTKSGEQQYTPEWLRSLGWSHNDKWRNIFWYHLSRMLLLERPIGSMRI